MNDPSKFWQISVNGATPQTFAQKFFHNVRRELRHTDLDRLTFVAGGRAIDGPSKGKKLQPVEIEDGVYYSVARFWYGNLPLTAPLPPKPAS